VLTPAAASVPEPSTLLLLGIGMLGMAVISRLKGYEAPDRFPRSSLPNPALLRDLP
jgi:hypothetical protein